MSAWVTTIFCPSLALVINTVMWFAPMAAVLEVRKTKQLGDLNVVPFAFTVLNCIGWVIYSLFLNDAYVFWGNMPGVVVGMWYCQISMGILFNQTNPGQAFCKTYRYMEGILLFACAFWSVVSVFATTLYRNDVTEMNNVIGICCVVFRIAYYGAPLSTIYKVISKRDASSLYPPLIFANVTGAVMWTVYGITLGNLNLWLPNCIGAFLAAIQVSLIIIFHKRDPQKTMLDFYAVTPETVIKKDKRRKSVEQESHNVLHSAPTNNTSTTSSRTSIGEGIEMKAFPIANVTMEDDYVLSVSKDDNTEGNRDIESAGVCE